MKRLFTGLLLLFLVLSIAGCKLWWEDRRLYRTYDIPDEGIRTPDQAVGWVYDNIEYKSEGGEFNSWQTPQFTYKYRTGDCEDFVILWMYFVEEQANMPGTQLVALYMGADSYHAMGYYDGWFYECTGGWRTEDVSWLGSIVYWMDYDEAIDMALKKALNDGN